MTGSDAMSCLSGRCRGESHKVDGKPCQDYVLTLSERGLTMAVVCDGHGGERYFRSDVGAKFAAEVTKEAIRLFVGNIPRSIFSGKKFSACGPDLSEKKVDGAVDAAMRQLFSSIITRWNGRINSHAVKTPISEWEEEHVKKEYIEDLRKGVGIEKVYGCTLMVFVKTREYWFAFHIGDGKCISFHPGFVWKEPIPWDERCFLNKTTSICDSDALDKFRYCYQGDGSFPTAVFLGSDGMDDSFGETENLVNFYVTLAKAIVKSEKEAKHSLEDDLPELSRRGSKDDMSVACIYNRRRLERMIPELIDWQISRNNASIEVSRKLAKEKEEAQKKRKVFIRKLFGWIR